MKQDPTGFARLDLDAPSGPGAALTWQAKHVLTWAELSQPPLASALRLRAICLPHVAHAYRTRFEPVPAREAFLALTPLAVTHIPAARPETLRLGAAICRAFPAYRVALGTYPSEIDHAFAAFTRGLPGGRSP